MTKRIQYHSLQKLFRLFSFLADKSGGWAVFVEPKLLIGSLIIGTSLTACQSKEIKKAEDKNKNSLDSMSDCYTTVVVDTPKVKVKPQKLKTFKVETQTTCYFCVAPQPSGIEQPEEMSPTVKIDSSTTNDTLTNETGNK